MIDFRNFALHCLKTLRCGRFENVHNYIIIFTDEKYNRKIFSDREIKITDQMFFQHFDVGQYERR